MAIRGRSASPRTQCFIDVLEEALAFGNQHAMREGNQASPRTQCFIDVLEEALAFGHVIARVVARLPSRVISMQ